MAHRFVGTTAIVRLEPKMPLRAIIPECSDEDDKLEASFVSNSVVSDIGRLQDRRLNRKPVKPWNPTDGVQRKLETEDALSHWSMRSYEVFSSTNSQLWSLQIRVGTILILWVRLRIRIS